MLLLQIHAHKNANNCQQKMKLKAANEIHNQFDISLNATNAKLSGKWNVNRGTEVKWSDS